MSSKITNQTLYFFSCLNHFYVLKDVLQFNLVNVTFFIKYFMLENNSG